MTMPNFLVIGAAKSGTSALYHYLRQHPQIYMSPVKEPHYFAFVGQPPQTQGPGDAVNAAITDLGAYRTLFAAAADRPAVGEASPTYLYVPQAAHCIYAQIPQARLVAILRHPVDRAYSAYMHVIRDGREPIADFALALEAEEERVRQNWGPIWHYTRCGFYAVQLRRYFDLFEREQLRVYLYDEFSRQPQQVLADIFRFLQVDPTFVPDMSVRPNVSGVPRSKLGQRLIDRLFLQSNPIKSLSRRFISEEMRWRFTAAVRARNLERLPIEPALRRRLNQLYRPEIEDLAQLLGRDLSGWLGTEAV